MKQGKHFFQFLPVPAVLVCLFYLGGAAVFSRLEPLQRVTALYTEGTVCVDVTGVVIRDEILLSSPYADTVPLLPEGGKVGLGQTVALGFTDTYSAESLEEQASAERRMRQLRLASEHSPRTETAEIRGLLVALAAEPLREDPERLKALILGSMADPFQLREQLQTLESARNESDLLTEGIPLAVEESGWFSGMTDGFEAVLTPEWLWNSAGDEPIPAAQPVSQTVYGKLIRSETWYFSATLPQTQLQGLEVGDTVTADFGTSRVGAVFMRVERLEYSGSGMCRLILSCSRALTQVTSLRQQSCTLIFHTYSGLLVPRAAVCHNETGQAGVFVLEGAAARWKPITVLHTEETTCVAEMDRTDTAYLWPGDEILLGKNLYDGKVVYP